MGTDNFRRVDAATGEIVVLEDGAPLAGIYFYEGR